MRKYDFYSDPRHGWLKVERRELVELGIENQISGYSYQKGDTVYLEEDSDAPKFIDAWEAKHQIKLMNCQINFHYRASRIRAYQPFTPQAQSAPCGHPAAEMSAYQQQCKDCNSIFKDEPELVNCPSCGSKRIEINQAKEQSL